MDSVSDVTPTELRCSPDAEVNVDLEDGRNARLAIIDVLDRVQVSSSDSWLGTHHQRECQSFQHNMNGVLPR